MLELDTTAVKKIIKVIELIKYDKNLDGIDIYHHLRSEFKDMEQCYTLLNLLEQQDYIKREYHGVQVRYILSEYSLTILN